jgi:hypothetical protein
VHTLIVNRGPEAKVYAMTEGGSTISEVDGKVLDDLEAELLDTKVVSLEPSEVRELAFGGKDAFSFEKTGENWKLAGEPSFQVDAAKVTDALNTLRDLKAKSYVTYSGANLADYGLASPALTVRAVTEAGAQVELMMSDKGPGGDDRYATLSTSKDRVFVLGSSDVGKFKKQPKDFQVGTAAPPPPAPMPMNRNP